MQVSPAEVKTIVTAFRNPDALRSSGILLGGQKFLYIQSDESQIQGKKGPSGVSVARSDKCKCQLICEIIVMIKKIIMIIRIIESNNDNNYNREITENIREIIENIREVVWKILEKVYREY